MDKLKPILAQKFWILSSICLLLPLTGWWMSTATMAKEITDRTKTINEAFTGIPQPGPNKNWTDKVEALNVEESKKVKETGDFLWEQEKSLMVWPDIVSAEVETAGYRAEVDAKTRGEYRYVYQQLRSEVHAIVNPYDPFEGKGVVDFSIDLIPDNHWETSPIPPSTKEMWDTQEDLWLYQSLLTAVKNINDQFGNKPPAVNSIVNATIKQIVALELRGGTPSGAAKAPTAGPAGAPAAGAGDPKAMMMHMAGPTGAAGGGGGGESDTLNATFNPADQLGSDDDPTGGGTGASPTGGPMGPMGPMGPPMPPTGGGHVGGGKGMAMPASGMGGGTGAKKRYIEEMPRYKTRGFYMEVVMNHRMLPEFLAELSDSKWPLRVIRVQEVDRDLSDIGGGSIVGTGGTMGAMMGAMGKSHGAGGGPRMPGMLPPPTASGGHGGKGPKSGPAAMMPRPGARNPIGGGEDAVAGESGVDLQTVLADPSLVNVALSGIITIYLPPEAAAAVPGLPSAAPAPSAAPDAPDAAPATTPSTAVPGVAPTTPATPAATETSLPTGQPAEAPLPSTTPATDSVPETKPLPEAKPAATEAPPAKPATPAPTVGTKPEPGK